MNFKEKIVMFLATGAYIGRIPFAPGTFGALIGLPVYYLLSMTSLSVAAVITIALIVVAVWASEHAEQLMGKKDPGSVVIDEVAGMVVTLLGIPFGVVTAICGFVLFRIFDIAKPHPVRYLQDDLPGGAGIVMDDIAAGIISNIILRVICLALGIA
jgi:phosphatidylglycerophosphatase A